MEGFFTCYGLLSLLGVVKFGVLVPRLILKFAWWLQRDVLVGKIIEEGLLPGLSASF